MPSEAARPPRLYILTPTISSSGDSISELKPIYSAINASVMKCSLGEFCKRALYLCLREIPIGIIPILKLRTYPVRRASLWTRRVPMATAAWDSYIESLRGDQTISTGSLTAYTGSAPNSEGHPSNRGLDRASIRDPSRLSGALHLLTGPRQHKCRRNLGRQADAMLARLDCISGVASPSYV
jgi:hypothetical protein